MDNKLKWLTGSDDIEEFANNINEKNKDIVTEPINLGSNKHCDMDIISSRHKFVEKGYVKISGIFTERESEKMERWVTNAVNRRFSDFNYQVNGNYYSQQFSQCLNLWEDFPEIRKIAFSPKLTRIAASLLGVEKIRLWQDQALFKHPDGRNTSAHQDLPFWPMDDSQCLTAWIVLNEEGSTLENGAMGYVPKSHTSGLRHFSNITTGNSIGDFAKRDREILGSKLLQGEEPEYIEASRGSVIFHHGLTVHLAKPNLTSNIRKVYTVVYFKDGTRRGSQIGVDQSHFAVDRDNLKIKQGQIINSCLTPIAYPIKNVPYRPPGISHKEYTESEGSLPRPMTYDLNFNIMSLL